MYEQAQRRRLLFGIVSTPEDLANNPQLEYMHWLTEVEHPELGVKMQYPGAPYAFAESPWAIRRRPPLLGEHTAEVLAEVGITTETISSLESQGVV
jgi:crotonobetainyl-CoA:carnitine CoA-transferase CaiB-like acyl-CoA transferase